MLVVVIVFVAGQPWQCAYFSHSCWLLCRKLDIKKYIFSCWEVIIFTRKVYLSLSWIKKKDSNIANTPYQSLFFRSPQSSLPVEVVHSGSWRSLSTFITSARLDSVPSKVLIKECERWLAVERVMSAAHWGRRLQDDATRCDIVPSFIKSRGSWAIYKRRRSRCDVFACEPLKWCWCRWVRRLRGLGLREATGIKCCVWTCVQGGAQRFWDVITIIHRHFFIVQTVS